MHNNSFQNANKVFVGVLRTNKENGLDVRKPKQPISKHDLEKLYEEYLIPGMDNDTEILQYKVFVDLVYFMGRRAKEGLRQLQKSWFEIKEDDTGTEYVEITVRESTKKNQGDNLSTSATYVHDDNNLMFAQPDSPRCPVKSFKKYIALLSDKIGDFFQRPSYHKDKYDAMAVGKNHIGKWMSVLSERANLSRRYTNHELRKTTATGMKKGGVPIPDIAHHLKHKDLQTLSHYLEKPTIADKKRNAAALHNYTISDGNPQEPIDEPQPHNEPPESPQQNAPVMVEKENVLPQNAIIPFQPNFDEGNNAQMAPVLAGPAPLQNNQVVNNNQLKQAPALFAGATFSNCTINLNIPQ